MIIEDKVLRQTGRTTRLIQLAPRDAIFVVWKQEMVADIRKHANDFGRSDLTIVAAHFLTNGSLRGQRKPLVVDHVLLDCALLTPLQYANLVDYWTSCDSSRNKLPEIFERQDAVRFHAQILQCPRCTSQQLQIMNLSGYTQAFHWKCRVCKQEFSTPLRTKEQLQKENALAAKKIVESNVWVKQKFFNPEANSVSHWGLHK